MTYFTGLLVSIHCSQDMQSKVPCRLYRVPQEKIKTKQNKIKKKRNNHYKLQRNLLLNYFIHIQCSCSIQIGGPDVKKLLMSCYNLFRKPMGPIIVPDVYGVCTTTLPNDCFTPPPPPTPPHHHQNIWKKKTKQNKQTNKNNNNNNNNNNE